MNCITASTESQKSTTNFTFFKDKYNCKKIKFLLQEIKELNNKKDFSTSNKKIIKLEHSFNKLSKTGKNLDCIVRKISDTFHDTSFNEKINRANGVNPSFLIKLLDIECSLLEAKYRLNNTFEFLLKYYNEDEATFIKILGILIETEDPWKILAAVQNFNFSNKENLQVFINKFIFTIEEFLITEKFKEYKIIDQEIKIEIAKQVAKCNTRKISIEIEDFQIEDPSARCEIALLVAQVDSLSISLYFRAYDINDEEDRIHIAKCAIEQDPYGPAMYLENYNITNKIALFELAKLCAMRNGILISECIQGFHIENPDHLFEIAKLAIKENTNWNLEYFENYGLTNPAHLNEIAELAAAKIQLPVEKIRAQLTLNFDVAVRNIHENIEDVLEHFERYNLIHPNYRYEIAKLIIQLDCEIILEYFRHFRSMLEKDRIEIAKMLAQQNGKALSTHIEQFDLDNNENALTEIATLAIQNNPLKASAYFKFNKIQDQTKKFQLFLLAYSKNQNVIKYLCKYKLFDYLPKQLYDLFNNKTGSINILELSGFCKKQWPDADFSTLFQTVYEKEDIQQKNLQWLLYMFSQCSEFARGKGQGLSSKQMQWILNRHIVTSIVKLRDPSMRYILADYLIEISTKKHARQSFKQVISNKDLSYVKHSHLLLFHLLEDKNALIAISKKIKEAKIIFKDASAEKTLLRTLYILDKENSLSPSDKLHLLNTIFENIDDKKKCLAQLNAIQGIISLGNIADLKKESLIQENPIDLLELHMKAFQKKLDIGNIDNFTERYQETFKKFRLPNALPIYLHKLSLLPAKDKNDAIELLAEFCSSVLLNTFKSKRYNRADDIHLRRILGMNDKLKGEWEKGDSRNIETFFQNKLTSEDVVHFLKDKLLFHIHFSPLNYQFIREHILAATEEEKKQNWINLKNAMKKTSLLQEKNLLKIQELLIQLLNPEMDIKRKENQLRSLNELLKSTPQNKLENLVQELLKKLNPYKDWIVVDTDDPCDLMLCGTEIVTCQDIVNGRPYYNRCLLAYLMEGKNRLIAIKDKNGRIKARCIIRLLWDLTHNIPVLFQEEYYPSYLDVDHILVDVLNQMCIERAKALNLTLLSQNDTIGTKYRGEIISADGRAPYEYVDALENLAKNCRFVIDRHLYEVKTNSRLNAL